MPWQARKVKWPILSSKLSQDQTTLMVTCLGSGSLCFAWHTQSEWSQVFKDLHLYLAVGMPELISFIYTLPRHYACNLFSCCSREWMCFFIKLLSAVMRSFAELPGMSSDNARLSWGPPQVPRTMSDVGSRVDSYSWRARWSSSKSNCCGAVLCTGTERGTPIASTRSQESTWCGREGALFLEAQGFRNIRSAPNLLYKHPSPIKSGVTFLRVMWVWCPSFRKNRFCIARGRVNVLQEIFCFLPRSRIFSYAKHVLKMGISSWG